MNVFVKCFIWVSYFWGKMTGRYLRGIGYVQRFLKKEFVFKYKGKYFQFVPFINGSYDFLLIGKSNEPETPLFLEKIIPHFKNINFVDVGASVGEMIIDVSRYDNVERIYAFEPRTLCCDAIKKTIALNNEIRIKLYSNIVSLSNKEVDVFINPGGTSSGIYDTGATEKTLVKSVTLDSVLPTKMDNTIILVDVEGAEPLVLESGINFIKKNRPLIIFEYNSVSKNHFTLDDIKKIVGEAYRFFRIKSDASLDCDFHNSWNVVAIPNDSDFDKLLNPT